MVIIPLVKLPAQRFQVVLDGQFCTIALRQKGIRMYLDLDTADNQICAGAICVDRASIVQSPSPYFSGELYFFDSEGGGKDPQYELLHDRFFLIYISADDPLPTVFNIYGAL